MCTFGECVYVVSVHVCVWWMYVCADLVSVCMWMFGAGLPHCRRILTS